VIMSKHLHVVLKTPEPNLARGMQGFLSAYANVWARRHRFNGHVFQGRYRTELVEDETYLWTVTRYVHLNPVRARLAEHPAAWQWSSYPGYARVGSRLEWVAYDELLASWGGEFGGSGSEPAAAYRRYVTEGLSEQLQSPWSEAYHGWVLGSQKFVDRVRAMVRDQPRRDRRRESRRMLALSVSRVSEVICAEHGIELSDLGRRGSRTPACAAMAWSHRPAADAAVPNPRACGDGVPGASTHSGDELRVNRDPRRLACGERSQPDTAIRGLVDQRSVPSQTIEAS
jgi:hypothetical protein